MNQDHERASPADDGGHQGSMTRPQDTLELRPTDPRPDADSEHGRHPPTDADPSDGQSLARRPARGALAGMLAVLFVVLAVAYMWSLGRF